METTYTLLFYAKREKETLDDTITIYARITGDGIEKEYRLRVRSRMRELFNLVAFN